MRLCILLSLFIASFTLQARDRALIINGGGNAANNHPRYIENMRNMLRSYMARGIAREDVTILASDGVDPTPDVNTRYDAGLFPENTPSNLLGSGNNFVDVNGPATKASIREQIREITPTMNAGDTFHVFVTDHGNEQGQVILWGENQRMTPAQFKKMVRPLTEKGVRISLVASHCYAGHWHDVEDENFCVMAASNEETSTVSSVHGSEFVRILTHCLRNRPDQSMLDCYYNAHRNDPRNHTGRSSREMFLMSYLESRGRLSADLLRCESENSSYSVDSFNELFSFVTNRTRDMYSYVFPTSDGRGTSSVQLSYELARQTARRNQLFEEYRSLTPALQMERYQEYSDQFDEIDQRIESLERIVESGTSDIPAFDRVHEGRPLTFLDFRGIERDFFSHATAESLREYQRIVECLNAF